MSNAGKFILNVKGTLFEVTFYIKWVYVEHILIFVSTLIRGLKENIPSSFFSLEILLHSRVWPFSERIKLNQLKLKI